MTRVSFFENTNFRLGKLSDGQMSYDLLLISAADAGVDYSEQDTIDNDDDDDDDDDVTT